jgi:hypothetical protein
MSDNGRLEATAAWIAHIREGSDRGKLKIGLAVLGADRRYGAGVVNTLARDTNISRASLYEYATVMRFLLDWKALSARRIFDDHPTLTFTHLRIACKLAYEEAIEALLKAEEEMMTPDKFGVYVAKLRGRTVPAEPLFDAEGRGHEVMTLLSRNLRGWSDRRVRVVVREVEQ